MFASLMLAAVSASAPGPVLDSESARPYDWRVVLVAKPHPLLTQAFRGQIVRDLKAALGPLAGELAHVEVVDFAQVGADAKYKPAAAIDAKGWAALDDPAFRTLTGTKTHVVTLDVRDTGFRLETRQLDGSTGLLSPLVRSADVPTADTVGRIAGLLVARDFGVVATVVKQDPKAGTVTVQFRGEELPGFDKFATLGDIFAVAAIREIPAKADGAPTRIGEPRAYTLLRVAGPRKPDGTTCEVLTRWATPLPPARGVVGYRGLKLATVDGPIRVRVTDTAGKAPPPGTPLRLRATDADYSIRPDPRDALELRNGEFRSARTLRGVACLTVGLGGTREERFPLPILGPEPAVVRFEVNEAEAAKAAFERDCEELRGRAAEARAVQTALFAAVGRMIEKGQYREALDRATAGQKTTDANLESLSGEIAKLRENPNARNPLPAALLASADGHLKVIRTAAPSLTSTMEDVRLQIEKAKDPVRFEKEFRARELTTAIRHHLEIGEIPEAIAKYDALIELTKSDDARAQKSKLVQEWEPKSGEVKAARLVVDDWKQLSDVPAYKQAAPKLAEAAQTMISEKDRLGLRYLLAAIEPSYVRLKEIADTLDPSIDGDRATIKDVQTVAEDVRSTEAKVREALKGLEK